MIWIDNIQNILVITKHYFHYGVHIKLHFAPAMYLAFPVFHSWPFVFGVFDIHTVFLNWNLFDKSLFDSNNLYRVRKLFRSTVAVFTNLERFGFKAKIKAFSVDAWKCLKIISYFEMRRRRMGWGDEVDSGYSCGRQVRRWKSLSEQSFYVRI